MSPKLIIFDCDGTLVDTESIFQRVFIEELSHLGVMVPPTEGHWFVGKRTATVLSYVEKKYEIQLDEAFLKHLERKVLDAYELDLGPIAYAEEVLTILKNYPKCVASNGGQAHIARGLRLTKLDKYFDHIYSAHDVNAWKPKPDLFLYAVNQFSLRPEECLVIEDSPVGVEAAKRAKIPCIQYAPIANPEQNIQADYTITDLRQILSLIR